MIRINLLPFRAARKKENIKRQITVYILTVVLFIVAMAYISFIILFPTVSDLNKKEQDTNNELAKYQTVIKKINKMEKQIKEINEKRDVIKNLEKQKSGPVHLMEELSVAVPKEKLWLNSFKETKGSLTLTGTAMDNETVALFMVNLESSEYIQSVELKSTKLRSMPEFRLRVSDFVLDCKTYAYQEKKKSTKKK